MAEIPRRMRHLPKYRGFPVPYVQFVGDDGEPDFKVIDQAKKVEVVSKHRCGICNQPLGETVAFIGGGKSMASGMFTDPPMHSECARYAAQTCPYLARSDRHFSSADPKHLEEGMVVHKVYNAVDENIPRVMGIYYTKSYDLVCLGGDIHNLYIKAGPSTSKDMDIMPPSD